MNTSTTIDQGPIYRDTIDKLSLAVMLLSVDPYRNAIQDGYSIWNKIPPEVRQHLTFQELGAVLDAIQAVATREIH